MSTKLPSPMAKIADKAAQDGVPITSLSAGCRGTVIKIQGEPGLRQHLLEMGFTCGTMVEFLRQAPLGDPIDLRLRGYRLSLRRVEAAAIIVQS